MKKFVHCLVVTVVRKYAEPLFKYQSCKPQYLFCLEILARQSDMSASEPTYVEPGDALDETCGAMRLVVSFVRLSGEKVAEDFEFVGFDSSHSIGCLFQHLKLSSSSWALAVGKLPPMVQELAGIRPLWDEASTDDSDKTYMRRLVVTVVWRNVGPPRMLPVFHRR